ncbi:MAG: hypothetical protein JNK82_24100, partial [Myxococcaceae bacterium]|nr:hypothetical protein [Myxococcaceae bacterium]
MITEGATKRLAIGLITASVLLVACNLEGSPPPLKSTARVIKPVLTATKSTGESCAQEGVSVCRPGPNEEEPLCLHYGPGIRDDGTDPGFICTHACSRTNDCELELECIAIVPGAGKLCAPRSDFVPHVVTARPRLPPDPAPPQ